MNNNVHFLFYLILRTVRQDTKICNRTTNDFSVSWPIDFLAFIEERAKENNIYLIGVFIIENVEVRLTENGSRKYRDIVGLYMC